MNKKLLVAGILRTLARFKLRTFFMSLGIVVGVAVLVATRSMGAEAERAMTENVSKMMSASSLFVRAGGGGMGAAHDGPTTTLKMDDLVAVADAVPEVAAWEPFQMLGGQDVSYQGTSRQLTIHGFTENAEEVWGRYVAVGNPITAEDVRASARVAILGPKTADALFGDEDGVGRQVQIGSVAFRVQGVLEPYGMDPHGMDRDDEVHVPVTTLMRRLQNVDYLRGAKLIVENAGHVEEVAEKIAGVLRERHAISPGEDDDFSLVTPALVQRMVKQANRVLQVFLPAGAGVVLLVAAIVIANVMLTSVRERIPEIGLRKAMGATDGHIQAQFLSEAVAVTLFSGLVGVAVGAGVVAVAAKMTGMATIITFDAVVLGLGAASLVGVLSGYLPARQAARLEAIDALR